MRKTKIVATVGPACSTEKILQKLILEGVDVFRLNASHTDPKGLTMWVHRIRRAAKQIKKDTAILVDLQGPRVRTGRIKGSTRILRDGQNLRIKITALPATSPDTITTSCRPFAKMVKKGDPILIDNGLIELTVKDIKSGDVLCRVARGGVLGENKGINLPNAPVTLPALTAKDLADLAAAAKLDVDFIALSFVRSHEDIKTIKEWMKRRDIHIPVIAKIEKPKAVTGIRAILEKADGIMVARGDLGIEMGVEKVPGVQKILIEEAMLHKVPVITATQMLETMMERSQPTRAEVSDIANAVFDGTDAVMLSGETAIGKYPVESVQTMRKIIDEAEKTRKILSLEEDAPANKELVNLRAITQAALYAARELNAKAIMVFTLSGVTAQYVSKLNPSCMVLAATRSPKTVLRLKLLRGVVPVLVGGSNSMKDMLQQASARILSEKILKKGDGMVVVYGKRALPGTLYTIAIHHLGLKAAI